VYLNALCVFFFSFMLSTFKTNSNKREKMMNF